MHVLVTTDTLSGVWSYTRELVSGLITRGHRVTLVSLGEIPLPQQTAWMEGLHGLSYHPTAFRLEWMQEAEQDLSESIAYLQGLIAELSPDLLHFNHFCFGAIAASQPKIVVAHGDYLSWWKAVHDTEPSPSRWLRWYRDTVREGLRKADSVVAPSFWMLESVQDCFGEPSRGSVIYNGRNPIFFNPYLAKDDCVLAIGRLLDAGKQVNLITQHRHPVPVCIVGSEPPIERIKLPIRADIKVSAGESTVALKGPQTEAQLRNLYGRSAIYAATSRYEPFGMAALEAALSRCAIVANDIPSFREIWGDAALYFDSNDASSLAATIRRLSDQRDLCRAYANRAYNRARERFTAKRMIDEYLSLYGELLQEHRAAA